MPRELTPEEVLFAFLTGGASIPIIQASLDADEADPKGGLGFGVSDPDGDQDEGINVESTYTHLGGSAYAAGRPDMYGRNHAERALLARSDPDRFVREYVDKNLQNQWRAKQGKYDILRELSGRGGSARGLQSAHALGGGGPIERAFSAATGGSTPQAMARAAEQRNRDVQFADAYKAGTLQNAQQYAQSLVDEGARSDQNLRELPLNFVSDAAQLITTGTPGTSSLGNALYPLTSTYDTSGSSGSSAPSYQESLGSFYSV